MKYSLKQLAELLDARIEGDPSITIGSIAPLDTALSGQASFITSRKFKAQLKVTKASVILLKEAYLVDCPSNALVVSDPYLAYAKLAQLLDTSPSVAYGISQGASIDPSASIAASVAVGPNAVIAAGVQLAAGVEIGPGAVVGENVSIGANTKIMPNVTIYHDVIIGESCVIHSNTVVGSDGFGYANDRGAWVKIPQVGRVIMGNNVEIGASTCIDRGALKDTIIGKGVIIDNQCQIAHNVEIGDYTALAGAVTIAGSTKIGRYCVIGGAAVINGHLTICDQVQITGMTMLMRTIKEPGVYSSGIPAQTNKEWKRTAARTLKIDDMYKRLQQLEKQLEQQTSEKL